MATYGWADLNLLLVNGIQAHNETTEFRINDLRAGVVDVTKIGATTEQRAFDGILSAKFSQTIIYDSATGTLTEELFGSGGKLTGGSVANMPVVVALTGNTRGKPFIGMPAMLASIGTREVKRGDVNRVTIDYESASSGGLADGKIIDWGSCAAGASTGYVDMGTGATTAGGYFHVHLCSYTSTPTLIAVKLTHCTTSGGTYTDVAGATTGSVAVGNLPIGFGISIPSGTTLNQFVKAFYTFTGGTAPTVLAFAGLVRH